MPHTCPPLDALDLRLLRAVQKRCTATAEELAEQCATSPSTALRRIKRLRENGVIRGEVALLDPDVVGRGIMLMVSVRLEREDGPGVDAFVKRVTNHPAVQQFYFVTGTTDYLIMLSVGSMTEYDDFLQRNLVRDSLVVMSNTNVVIRPLKMSLAVPV